jgi:hypothetical protein
MLREAGAAVPLKMSSGGYGSRLKAGTTKVVGYLKFESGVRYRATTSTSPSTTLKGRSNTLPSWQWRDIRLPTARAVVCAVGFKSSHSDTSPGPAVGCMLWQKMATAGLNAMGKLVADVIVETLQNAGVKHCYGVMGDTACAMRRVWRPYRSAAQQKYDQASLPWADRDCSIRGSYWLCPSPDILWLSEARLRCFC